MKRARIIAWTAPAAIVLTVGATAAGLNAALPGTGRLTALVTSAGARVALGLLGTTRDTAEPPPRPSAPPPAQTGEAADTSVVILKQPEPLVGLATVTVAAAAPPTEPELVDYAQLNEDVLVVADTLERFNQKLLRIIAQARAEQLRAEAQAASTSQVEPDPNAVSQAPPVPVTPLDVETTP